MICLFAVLTPLVRSYHLLYKPLGHNTLKTTKQNYIVLTVEINPTLITTFPILPLHFAYSSAIPDVIKRLTVNIAKYTVKILAQRHGLPPDS